jgi:hypothetical protein
VSSLFWELRIWRPRSCFIETFLVLRLFGSGERLRLGPGVAHSAVELQLLSDPRLRPAAPSQVYIHMAGIEAYYRGVCDRGGNIIGPLVDREWGMKDFRVLDPSGNQLGFAEVLSSASMKKRRPTSRNEGGCMIRLMKTKIPAVEKLTIGLDLGARRHHACVLDEAGEIIAEETIVNTREVLSAFCDRYPGATVLMETGTHSPWVSRLVSSLGHAVMVANARKLRAISQSQTKSDHEDAQMLARFGRSDTKLLSPIRHLNSRHAFSWKPLQPTGLLARG